MQKQTKDDKGYRAERDGDKVLIYKGDDLVARYNIQDGDN